ncbi:hypothetical protein C8250_015495 [Streptomyces sp. So13.3]|uniref:hypothetical protein n=1 Tax=unclassified Streptomyces TaxID=2593676 RepID=UPI00110655EE|nr:hypothetical protein [Streptomyces sp. So13.3]NEA75439.1 hypothetical protein [Streptomyces sp. SID13588]QNA73131.1 hypothetical protein C8250_015495 [Streptomyces sp. So13.3]
MSRARLAFAAHPDAIADLRELPDAIRDQALLHLQDLVHGERVAKRLEGRLDGFHKVYLGTGTVLATHRLVVQFRPAPPDSVHVREVYLVAAGARKDYAVYRTAQFRTGLAQNDETSPTVQARVHAARSRSPHPDALTSRTAPAIPAAVSTPAPTDSRKAILR